MYAEELGRGFMSQYVSVEVAAAGDLRRLERVSFAGRGSNEKTRGTQDSDSRRARRGVLVSIEIVA
jgi:hypothetical protein